MRILLLTHYYAPEYGAPQRRWSALVGRFIAAGHRVTVAAPVPHYPQGRPTRVQRRSHRVGAVERGMHGETVVRTAYLPHRGDMVTRTADHLVTAVDSLRRLRRRFARPQDRPDVIIATAPAVPTLLVGRALSALWGVPQVVEMRDAWPDLVTQLGAAGHGASAGSETGDGAGHGVTGTSAAGSGGAGITALVKGAVHRRVTSWQSEAHAVVTTTARFAEVLRERGVQPVRVVRNGTDLSRVARQHDHPPGDHAELRCLYLGNMGRSQGLETAVRAAARLHAEGVPLQLRLIGHGVEAPALIALARELDAPVEVLPRIHHREVGAQYAWADTVLVSLRSWSPFAWTVPSKLYEVLATGRHVTALLDGEAADIVRAADAGDVLPPEDLDALVALWRELVLDRSRAAVRASGREWVESHADDDELARTYLEMLRAVVAS
jgi:colanic acid biosynthesis glycosyl transferase WcaI